YWAQRGRRAIERHQREEVAQMRMDRRIEIGAHLQHAEADRRRDVSRVEPRRDAPALLVLERRLIDLLVPLRTLRGLEEPWAQIERPAVAEPNGRADVEARVRPIGGALPLNRSMPATLSTLTRARLCAAAAAGIASSTTASAHLQLRTQRLHRLVGCV